MAKPQPQGMRTNFKTRLAYGTGASQCSDKCICLLCKRKREESNKKPPSD
jgi:hypothetical protein